jgi:2-octaprenyl-6-methoxyphenol hydroxylase
MVKKNYNFDIIIIGSSYCGMSCALALAKISSQLKIAIIEKEDVFANSKSVDGRAYAISSRSLNFFRKIGIFDQIQPYSGQIKDIKITDNKSPFILDFLSEEIDESVLQNNQQFGQIVENHYIFEALKSQLKQQNNITIFCPNYYQEINFTEDSQNKVKVTLNDQNIITAKLLLACDGRFSKIRELFAIKTRIKDYHQSAIVFKIEHQLDHKNIAYEKFYPGGPLAILPLQNPKQSSIVWIVKNEMEKILLSLDQENFIQQLNKKTGFCLGECQIISERFSYQLNLVEAEKFFHQQCLLIGDAGCAIHPIAGQGFNLAISTIELLTDLIAKNILCGLEISSVNFIESFNKNNKINTKKMIIATDLLNSIFETKNQPITMLREFGLEVINSSKYLKKFFIKNAGGF